MCAETKLAPVLALHWIHPIFTKGNVLDPSKYRGIHLTCIYPKLWSEWLVHNRLATSCLRTPGVTISSLIPRGVPSMTHKHLWFVLGSGNSASKLESTQTMLVGLLTKLLWTVLLPIVHCVVFPALV